MIDLIITSSLWLSAQGNPKLSRSISENVNIVTKFNSVDSRCHKIQKTVIDTLHNEAKGPLRILFFA